MFSRPSLNVCSIIAFSYWSCGLQICLKEFFLNIEGLSGSSEPELVSTFSFFNYLSNCKAFEKVVSLSHFSSFSFLPYISLYQYCVFFTFLSLLLGKLILLYISFPKLLWLNVSFDTGVQISTLINRTKQKYSEMWLMIEYNMYHSKIII